MRFAVNGEKLALVAGLLACIQGCALAGVQLSGRVIDAETGDPVAGAYVYAESGHSEICFLDGAGCSSVVVDSALTRTSADGRYRFADRFNFGLTAADKFGDLIVYKRGYITSPKMISATWDRDFQSPEDYVSSNTVTQVFYGSGSYRKSYDDVPWNSTHKEYYLTSSPDSKIRGGDDKSNEARLTYLSQIIDQIKDRTSKVHPMQVAIYSEAKSLAKSPKGRGLLRSICLDAYGMSSILDKNKPCP